ncbi:hypothetical protein [Halococcus saccharolyticus]|uniref:Uncharacterized protein n=1 Tax=Halococcus saccharolyticus DSM 5350 TaxID=1227455 RepID=M0MHT5_9EURY|nr:hypothetical protein [Halococcus saccharolyticus]EMA44274.1 hypothetical protein C449_12128 [Halococcus saccharolyticus DSM 5350]
MSRYGSDPPTTDVAALSLGTAADDETVHATRQRAVEAAVGVLERRQGEVTSVPVAILREVAWAEDGGRAADSSREAWQEYVRPALSALSTVESTGNGRWRYCDVPDRAETERQAGDPGTSDAVDHDEPDASAGINSEQVTGVDAEDDPLLDQLRDPEGEGDAGSEDDVASLNAAARAGVEAADRAKRGEGNAALRAALLAKGRGERDTDGGPTESSGEPDANAGDEAALEDETPSTDRGPSPSPNGGRGTEDPSGGDPAKMGSDRAIRASVTWPPSAVATEDDRGEGAALSATANEADQDTADGPSCARCGEPVAESDTVDAPALDVRFPADGKMHSDCYRVAALGQERPDLIDDRER